MLTEGYQLCFSESDSAVLGPCIFALGTSQKKPPPLLDIGLEEIPVLGAWSHSELHRWARSWSCGYYSLSDQSLNQDPKLGTPRLPQAFDLPNWKQGKHHTSELLSKLWYIHPMKRYFKATKKE